MYHVQDTAGAHHQSIKRSIQPTDATAGEMNTSIGAHRSISKQRTTVVSRSRSHPPPAASPCVRTLRLNRLEWEGHPSWAAPSYIISTFACSPRVHETLPLTGQCSTRAVHPTFDILSLGVSSSRTPFKDVSGRRRYSTFVLFLDRFQSRWFVHFRREGLFLVLFAAQKVGGTDVQRFRTCVMQSEDSVF